MLLRALCCFRAAADAAQPSQCTERLSSEPQWTLARSCVALVFKNFYRVLVHRWCWPFAALSQGSVCFLVVRLRGGGSTRLLLKPGRRLRRMQASDLKMKSQQLKSLRKQLEISLRRRWPQPALLLLMPTQWIRPTQPSPQRFCTGATQLKLPLPLRECTGK